MKGATLERPAGETNEVVTTEKRHCELLIELISVHTKKQLVTTLLIAIAMGHYHLCHRKVQHPVI